ncbi:hypothetical protein [Acanthopleuribacter pedis]|uniref:Uncharacterized protein n=1 Tax=Acanthopleuribacter pedis TaxID=442870 RepID=A0A8J7QH51_9BACT|nr:hypothetical protein [Acanthopleuribacter pedis]MBO1320075.1 hypothetical protein [Acanthopleuribacter pedis]
MVHECSRPFFTSPFSRSSPACGATRQNPMRNAAAQPLGHALAGDMAAVKPKPSRASSLIKHADEITKTEKSKKKDFSASCNPHWAMLQAAIKAQSRSFTLT